MKQLVSRATALILALLFFFPLVTGGTESRAAEPAPVMSASQFVSKITDVVENYKTLYVHGGWGWPMNAENKSRAINSTVTDYNRQSDRKEMVLAATDDTFGFDCICVIKAILWGWTGDVHHKNGGAVYGAGGVADFGTSNAANYCTDLSETFDLDAMLPGEILLMQGHAGVYLGGGRVAECTPLWDNGMQYSEIDGRGTRSKNGSSGGRWLRHGKLKYLSYEPVTHTHAASCGWEEGYCDRLGIWRPNLDNGVLYRSDGGFFVPGTYEIGRSGAGRTTRPYGAEYGDNRVWALAAGEKAEVTGAVKNGLGEIWARVRHDGVTGYFPEDALILSEAAPSALTITIDERDAPTGPLPYKKTFGCDGKITSNYPLTEVTGTILSAAGETACAYRAVPGGLYYSIRRDGLDAAMLFNKLGVGSYLYIVTASDAAGTQRRFVSFFSVYTNDPAPLSYAVIYDANGGEGGPGMQTKVPGAPLALSASVPTRAGYAFTGWNTALDGSGAPFAPGALFEIDANTCLFARWKKEAASPAPAPGDEPLWGDANGDGAISSKDVVRLKNYLANYNDETGTSSVELFPGADANGDGAISSKDVVRLKNYLAHYNDETGTSSVPLGKTA